MNAKEELKKLPKNQKEKIIAKACLNSFRHWEVYFSFVFLVFFCYLGNKIGIIYGLSIGGINWVSTLGAALGGGTVGYVIDKKSKKYVKIELEKLNK